MSRYPDAVWVPGPEDKVGYSGTSRHHDKTGAVLHSMEGYRPGAYSRLMNPSEEASWHFSVYQDGLVEQHYEHDAVCWHAGYPANLWAVGIEHEGLTADPVTKPQLEASILLLDWLFETCGWGKPALRVNLWEHNWLMPTSCPSGRIPWTAILSALEEGEMDEALIDMVISKSLKPLYRTNELMHEAAEIRVALERWLLAMGTGDEDEFFQEFCRACIFWRIKGHGWSGPESW